MGSSSKLFNMGRAILTVGRTTPWVGAPGLYATEVELCPSVYAFVALTAHVIGSVASGFCFLDLPTVMHCPWNGGPK